MSLLGDAPFGDLPLGDFAGPSESIADALGPLIEHPQNPRTWILRMSPRDPGSGIVSVGLSTHGHKTRPGESEHAQFPQAVISPYASDISLGESLTGGAEVRFGAARLPNPRGTYDHLADYDWQGRAVDTYLGPRGGIWVQFARVARALSSGISWDRDSLTVLLEDYGYLLDKAIQTTLYAGTGGLEGDAAFAGRPKPLLFGQVRRFEPVAIDGARRIYQAHTGSMQGFDSVEDKGVALSFNANVADIEASVPPASTFNTAIATGHIRLGSTPQGTVTCTARGDSSGAGYADTITGIARKLATRVGRTYPDDWDVASEALLAAALPHATGLYTGLADLTARQALDRLFAGLAYWYVSRSAFITMGRITDPSALTPRYTIDQPRLAQQDRSAPFRPRVWQVRVGYRPYPRPMSDAELAASVPEATRADYAQPYRFAIAEDAAVLTETPEADSIEILTSLDTLAAAEAVAADWLALLSTQRVVRECAPSFGPLRYSIGDVIRVTDARYSTDRKYAVVGLRESAGDGGASDSVSLRLLG